MTKAQIASKKKLDETQFRIRLIEEMKQRGLNNKAIAEELHRRYPERSEVQHYRWIFSNVDAGQQEKMEERVKHVVELRESGLKFHDVAVRLGITTDQARYIYDRESRKKYWLRNKLKAGNISNAVESGFKEVISGKILEGDLIFWTPRSSAIAGKDQVGETVEFIRQVRPKARVYRHVKTKEVANAN
jgi:hypothetical protein